MNSLRDWTDSPRQEELLDWPASEIKYSPEPKVAQKSPSKNTADNDIQLNNQLTVQMQSSPLDIDADGEMKVPAYDFEKIVQAALQGDAYQLSTQNQRR